MGASPRAPREFIILLERGIFVIVSLDHNLIRCVGIPVGSSTEFNRLRTSKEGRPDADFSR